MVIAPKRRLLPPKDEYCCKLKRVCPAARDSFFYRQVFTSGSENVKAFAEATYKGLICRIDNEYDRSRLLYATRYTHMVVFDHLPEHIKRDGEFILRLVSLNASFSRTLPDFYLNDQVFVFKMLRANVMTFRYLPSKMRHDQTLIKLLIEIHGFRALYELSNCVLVKTQSLVLDAMIHTKVITRSLPKLLAYNPELMESVIKEAKIIRDGLKINNNGSMPNALECLLAAVKHETNESKELD